MAPKPEGRVVHDFMLTEKEYDALIAASALAEVEWEDNQEGMRAQIKALERATWKAARWRR